MKRLLWLGCWLLVSMGSLWPTFILADEPPATDCKLRQRASIDLTIGSIVLVPVTLDGVAGFMKLNAGLPLATISLQAAKERKFAIKNAPVPYSHFPGRVTIDSFLLGSYNLGKVQLLVTSSQISTLPDLPAAIGMFELPTLLLDYELDFANKKLNLFSTNHCPGNVVYWTDSAVAAIPYTLDIMGTPLFPIELDGKKISARLEMSGSGTSLKTDVSRIIYGFDEHSRGIRRTAESGKTINHYRAMKMTLPGLSVTNADVQLVGGSTSCNVSSHAGPEHSANYDNCFGNPPLKLGLDVLQHLRMYFATEEHVLYVTAADAGQPAASSEPSAATPGGDGGRN